jgi:hypothetical protein
MTSADRSHEMQLVRVDRESGAEHWHCHDCGRQLLLWHLPRYRKTVLVAGDEAACHTGNRGGLRFAQLRTAANGKGGETLH